MKALCFALALVAAAAVALADDTPAPRVGDGLSVVDGSGKIAYENLTYSPRDSVSFMKLQGALNALAAAHP